MNIVLKFAFSCLVFLTLVSCGGIPPTYYYRVDYDLDKATGNGHHLEKTLAVAQFSSDVLYETDKIVYRNSPYEAQFYHYRRWVAPPKKLVGERILRHLQTSRLFGRVVKFPASGQIDYILRGNLQAFEEWDEGDHWFGLVSVEFQLHERATEEVIWQAELSHKTQSTRKEPVEVVRAISESLNAVIADAIVEIKKSVSAGEAAEFSN